MARAFRCTDLEHSYGQDVAEMIDQLTVDDVLGAAAMLHPDDLPARVSWLRKKLDDTPAGHPLHRVLQGALRTLRNGTRRLPTLRGDCVHPSHRVYTWWAVDGRFCAACCDCGEVLQGGVS
jgi:hypothetical protein